MTENNPGTVAEYQKWLKDQEGKPETPGDETREELWKRQLDEQAGRYARGERPLDSAFDIDGEPDFKRGLPQGHLETTNLDAEELAKAIAFLETANKNIKEWIKLGALNSAKGHTLQSELDDLGNHIDPNPIPDEFSKAFNEMFTTLKQLLNYKINAATTIFDLPDEINDKLKIYKRALEREEDD